MLGGIVSPRVVALLAGSFLLASLPSCGSGGCPTARYAAERARWADDLRKAAPLSLNPTAPISIKRDVHEIVVGIDAAAFSKAFHQVMRDPNRRFGLIRVDRLPENVGQPFRMGERFQGRYELGPAGTQALNEFWKQIFGPVLDDPSVADSLCRIENSHTSDYGEIVRLELDAPREGTYAMEYRYLAPSPVSGSSLFEVSDIGSSEELAALGVSKASRVRQTFVYQEQSESFVVFFGTGGLRLHNQVVYSQVKQAAEVAQTKIIKSDIPPEYAVGL
jgi:hypothetical protein